MIILLASIGVPIQSNKKINYFKTKFISIFNKLWLNLTKLWLLAKLFFITDFEQIFDDD